MMADLDLQELLQYPTEEETEALLRGIPDTVADVLDMEPAVMLNSICRLHGLMSHWTTRLAAATGRLVAVESAKTIGLEHLKMEARRRLGIEAGEGERVTEAMVKERAVASEDYRVLCLAEAEAKTAHMQVKGLVESIVTKREALRMLSSFARQEMGFAGQAYSFNDVSASGMEAPAQKSSTAIKLSISKKTKDMLASAQKKMPRKGV